MNNRASVIEGIGLFLLLISFGWQCMEEDAQSTIQSLKIFQLESKMINYSTANMYATYLCSEYYQSDSISKKVEIQNIGNDIERGTYKSKELSDELQDFDNSSSYLVWIRRILYIIGSIFMIFPKLFPMHKIFTNKCQLR